MLSAHQYIEAPQTPLSWDRIEEILRYIDTVEPRPHANSDNAVATVIHNFGVFNVEPNCPLQPIANTRKSSDDDRPSPSYQAQDTHDDLDGLPTLAPFFDSFPSPTSLEEAAVAWDLCNLHYSQPPVRLDETYASTSPNADADSSPLALTHHSYNVSDTLNSTLDLCFDTRASRSNENVEQSTANTSWLMDSHDPPRSLEPFIVPVQERLLMDHYKNRVVNLFCVVDNRKSPWKTIHLPIVLQCVGELSFGGNTTRIRNALRYALYSVSAFYLSNEYTSGLRGDEARKWFNAASQYRCDAIGLLSHRPHYKEFLATMLSMITINVSYLDLLFALLHKDPPELMSHMLGYVWRHKHLRYAS